MEIRETGLAGVKLIKPRLFGDERGFFLEAWNAARYREAGLPDSFVQLNHSRSGQGTLRGLHLQLTRPQGKLVRVLSGRILDVAVDVRPGSPAYKQWTSAVLSTEDQLQLYIPPGFAHGFTVISGLAEVEYLTTDFYDPEGERSIRWDDPVLAIDWKLSSEPILSVKDEAAPLMEELLPELEVFRIKS